MPSGPAQLVPKQEANIAINLLAGSIMWNSMGVARPTNGSTGNENGNVFLTATVPKYLKTGEFMKILSVKIRISSKLSVYQDQDHASKQLYMYMPEPDV